MAESESEPRTCPENSPASAETTPGETGLGIAGIGRGPGREGYRWDKDGALEDGPEHWAVSREDLQRPYSTIKRRFLFAETWRQYAGGINEASVVSLAVWTLVAVVLGPMLRA